MGTESTARLTFSTLIDYAKKEQSITSSLIVVDVLGQIQFENIKSSYNMTNVSDEEPNS